MANVRIKDLTTTAATTASDDFFGVDGATNGTRKLNAFSPTFGGNLILGGTKLQLIAGANPYIQNGTTLGYLQLNDDGTVKLASSASNKTITLANGPVAMDGNLTVSGGTITGGTSGLSLAAGGSVQNITITPSGGAKTVIRGSDGGSGTKLVEFAVEGGSVVASINGVGHLTVPVLLGGGSGISLRSNAVAQPILFEQTSSVEVGRFAATTGNLLIGTTTDSANGKLQLATHTTSAGGIGFGTDVSLYRSAAATLTSTANNLFLANDSVFGGNFNTNVEVVASSNAIYLNTNGGTALTLDSSKNATFAGNITVNGAGPYTLKSRTIINRSDNTSATFGHLTLTRGTGAGNTAAFGTTGDASNGVASVTLSISDIDRFVVTSAGTVVLGTQAALATNATDGFTYIPVSAGAPTGTPTAYTGKVAMEYDTTNNKLYIYNGGWKSVTLA